MSDLDLLDDDDDAPRGSFGGLVIGTVCNVRDPDKLGRVKVVCPTVSSAVESHWARVLSPAAGARADDAAAAHGLYWPYEVGDEVVVGFLGGQMELPIVVGALWSKKRPAPVPEASLAAHRVLQSARGHVLRFDDSKDAEKIEIIAAGAKDSLALSTADGAVTISAAKCVEIKVGADITLTLKEGVVTLSCKQLVIKDASDVAIAGGSIAVDADQSLTLSGGSGINLNNGALEVSS